MESEKDKEKKQYMSDWQKDNVEKIRKSQYKWRASNEEYIRYKRLLNSAKNLVSPKKDSAAEKACLWAMSTENEKCNYIDDLENLQNMIQKRLKELKK